MNKLIVLLSFALVIMLQACGTTGSGLLYIEPSIKRQDIAIAKVAIVPNRLPLNLQDPEKWRRYNWGVAKDEFNKRGIKIVGYETTVKLFERSGLPVEDTKSSREKYAALAKVMGVDAIIVPYYGTFSSSKNIFLYANTISYDAVATFQIYLAKQNDFFTRVDVSGSNKYTAGILTSLGTALLFVPKPQTGSQTLSTISSVLSGGGFLIDLIQSLRSKDSRWKAAFKKGIREGLKPFFAAYSSQQPLSSLSPSPRFDDTPREETGEFSAARRRREAVDSERATSAPNRIGFSGGLSLAKIRIDPAPDGRGLRNRRGFGIGTFYERSLGENAALRFESNYVQKGVEDSGFVDQAFPVKITLKLAYIETTTMINIAPVKGTIRPYFMAGPTVGYLIGARLSIAARNGEALEEESEDVAESTSAIDFGFTFGGGIRFDFLFIEGRYALGLNNIFKDNDIEGLNRGIQILGGVSVPISR